MDKNYVPYYVPQDSNLQATETRSDSLKQKGDLLEEYWWEARGQDWEQGMQA